jgi:thioredoxin-like negative regulator of GroEL
MEEDARQKSGGSLPERFHYVSADVLAHLGRLDDARTQFQAEIAADPHDVQAYSDLALVEFMSGRRDVAMQTLARMTEVNPTQQAMELRKRGETAGRALTP